MNRTSNSLEFKYLRAVITNDDSYEKDLEARIISGNRVYYSLTTLLKSRILSRTAKILVLERQIQRTVLDLVEMR